MLAVTALLLLVLDARLQTLDASAYRGMFGACIRVARLHTRRRHLSDLPLLRHFLRQQRANGRILGFQQFAKRYGALWIARKRER